jgi:hypothetical protein
MQSSLAELLSALSDLSLDREFLNRLDKDRAAAQLGLREMAEAKTREETPGELYLPAEARGLLHDTIVQFWSKQHGSIIERYLAHPDLPKLDTDDLFGKVAMLYLNDAEREWEEITNGKFVEDSCLSFDEQGNSIRRLLSPGFANAPRMRLAAQLIQTTEWAKLEALKLKADAAGGIAARVEPASAEEMPAQVNWTTLTAASWTGHFTAFIDKIWNVTGERISYGDLDLVAGYEATSRKNLGKPRQSKGAVRAHAGVLALPPAEFIRLLGLKKARIAKAAPKFT